MERRTQFPRMHVYHYAHYENTAIKRLMTTHGVREATVDQLLRENRLVDLYKVVREGLRVSKPSYSIKAIEAFYSEKRASEVKKATDSIVVYEQWRGTRDPALLESIRQYNEEDCRSTWQLREWLLPLRPSDLSRFSSHEAEATTKKPPRAKSDKTADHERLLEDFHRRLVTHPENTDLDPEIAGLIDALLDFYRRAAKPQWWAIFDRAEAEIEDLMEESEVIAGLVAPEWVDFGDRTEIFRYCYPEQDFKVKEGDHAKRLDNLRDVRIHRIDEDACTVALGMSLKDEGEPPASLSISIGAPLETGAMQQALFVFAESAISGQARFKALLDYLHQRIPDIDGIEPGQPILGADEGPLASTISAVERLNASYLFIQGPPGTGKTYTGSHLIASLLKQGKRVAVSSNSHKAINNLLLAVDKRMRESNASYFGMKKVSSEDQGVESEFISNVYTAKAIIEADDRLQLVAGTAWLLARSDFWGAFDYLFIDEAGQVSLANTIAMGMCANNLVLLGDQMQLGQPIQGCHPGRSGESALEYLLNGEATITPERGVFLGTTYRMHPDVCRFISEAIYDFRLHSAPATFRQALVLDGNAHPAVKETGIRYLPVHHDACTQRSDEEAEIVTALVENLLTQRYRDGKGNVHSFSLNDILVVAPYNMQVNLLKRSLPKGARVGTVDKFQGQEAEVVIVSMATSSGEYLPRNVDFLFSKNRINVAASRARSLAVIVFNPLLMDIHCRTPNEMALVNTFAHLKSIG